MMFDGGLLYLNLKSGYFQRLPLPEFASTDSTGTAYGAFLDQNVSPIYTKNFDVETEDALDLCVTNRESRFKKFVVKSTLLASGQCSVSTFPRTYSYELVPYSPQYASYPFETLNKIIS